MNNNNLISIILPAYNEQENIDPICHMLRGVLEGYRYEIIFVDDGSRDDSLIKLRGLNQEDPRVKYLSFSRNFGHEQAIKAGLDHAIGDCVIVMDADMQHPVVFILKMLEHWKKGYEVVYTLRKGYAKISIFKSVTSSLFYKILNMVSKTPMTQGRADFFLLDRRVVDIIKSFTETQLYFSGIIEWVGFKQIGLDYQVEKRVHGTSKYSFVKLLEQAIYAVTSFSVKPLRVSIVLGAIVSLSAFIYLMYALYIRFCTTNVLSGWTSIMVCVLMIGGVQLIMLGVIGEYLGKLFMQAKGRPLYLIQEKSRE